MHSVAARQSVLYPSRLVQSTRSRSTSTIVVSSTRTSSVGQLFAVIAITSIFVVPAPTSAIRLTGEFGSYAQYPSWNGCNNASFSFEFRTTQKLTAMNTTLWYVDDGGSTDFFAIMLVHTRQVRLVLQLADSSDGGVEMILGREVNDGRWHRVEVRRKRATTFLVVDNETDSQDLFGDHFHFGQMNASSTDSDDDGLSHVYIGGMPPKYSLASGLLTKLAMPSVVFMDRFRGSFRNVVYSNCTCHRSRVGLVGGRVDGSPDTDDVCTSRNPCRDGCLCISADEGPTCDCSDLVCVGALSAHYELPMDVVLSGNRIANPSGLDARATGFPPLVRGVRRNAIQLNGRDNHVRVSGPAHRHECFGDLDKCPLGYTISLWANFTQVSGGRKPFVYLSNGGHTTDNHGVAMTYDGGTVEFRFRRRNGQEWTVQSDNVLPARWYHLMATWDPVEGLSMYVNGELVDHNGSPRMRAPTGLAASIASGGAAAGRPRGSTGSGVASEYNEFIIGKPNDGRPATERRPILVDEFHFWSSYMNNTDVKEKGPFYHYYAKMDTRVDTRIAESNMALAVSSGNPQMVPGKIKQAVRLDGRRRDVIESGPHGSSCLGNLSACQYGLTTSMWIRFDELQDGAYFMHTGNDGLTLYYRGGKLVGTARQGTKNWSVSWDGAEVNEWYFLELAWDPDGGLKMYVDMKPVSSDSRGFMRDVDRPTGNNDDDEPANNFYLGRFGGDMSDKTYGSATIDELDIWYGERSKLIELDFIARGRPTKHNVAMDAMSGSRITHPYLRVDTFGQPSIIPDGKIKGALRLGGNGQYASLGRQHDACLGNLDLCRHGMLLATWIKPGQLQDGMDLISSGSNGIKARYVNGQLRVTVKTSTREWTIPTDEFKPDRWQYLEIGWSPYNGLELYIDNKLVGQAAIPTVRALPSTPSDGAGAAAGAKPEQEQFQLGRGDGTQSNSRYGVMTLDDFEFWYGNRDYLLAHDYIWRGRPPMYLIDMDSMSGSRVVNSDLTVETHGGAAVAPGKVAGAVRLDGSGQYMDVGAHPKSCFGRLERCRHGITGSMWLNFRDFADNTYYLTSGGGLRLFYDKGKLFVVADLTGQRWEVSVPDLQKDQWYFVEYTWHPEKGLELYIDNRLVGSRKLPTSGPTGTSDFDGNRVLIGAANPTETEQFNYANGLIDEYETWFRDRDNLIAFDYIMRRNVTHISFPFEVQRGTVIVHPDHPATVHNGASLVPGRVGNGVQTEGSGEYVSLGDQGNTCMGNLELCQHGMLMSFYVKLNRMLQDGHILSSGAYSVYTKDNKLYAKFSLPTKTWELSTDQVKIGRWEKVELTWEPERGLQMYFNGALVGTSTTPTVHMPLKITDRNVYVGRPTNDNVRTGRYADAVVDELDYWYAGRSRLQSLGLLDDEVRRIIINMDEIVNDIVVNDKQVIYAVNKPRTVNAVIKNGIYLDGRDQYIEMPARDPKTAICHGDLQNCPKGFTLRFKVNPDQLVDGTSLISSPFIDVHQQNGRLNVELRTPTTVWRTVAPSSLPTGAWSQVEVAWHPVDGLYLLVDGEVVQQQTTGVVNRERYLEGGSFYVGRSIKDMSRRHYAHATFDDVQLWEAKRNILISDNLVKPGEDIIPKISSTVTPTISSTSEGPPLIFGTGAPIPGTGGGEDGGGGSAVGGGDGGGSAVGGGEGGGSATGGGISGGGSATGGGVGGDQSQLPVTFTTGNSYVKMSMNETFRSVDFYFRTIEPNGVLMYAANPVSLDAIGVEIFDGQLYVVVAVGSGPTRKYLLESADSTSGRVDDGRPHRVRIDLSRGGNLRLRLDESDERTERIVGNDGSINLGSGMFIGGIDDPEDLEWHVWSRGEPAKFYRGCLWGLRVNGGQVVPLAQIAGRRSGIEVGCRAMPPGCESVDRKTVCLNGSPCRQFWTGTTCDCSETAFYGETCGRAAYIMALNGSGFVRIDDSNTRITHTNDISVRFKTMRPDGMVFVTSNRRNNGYLKLSLENGRGVVETNIGQQRLPVQLYFDCPEPVSDGNWHTVHVKRRANVLEACIAGCTCQTTDMSGEGYTLDIDRIHIGHLSEDRQSAGRSFVGLVQNLIVDGQSYFDYLTSAGVGPLPPGLNIVIGGGVEISLNETLQALFAVTFRGRQSDESYAALQTLQIVGDTRIVLMIRTSVGDRSDMSDGILLYNGGITSNEPRPTRSGGDHFVIELVDGGRLRVGVDDGGGDRSVFSRSPSLSDSLWHVIEVFQAGPRSFTVRVDGQHTDALNLATSRNTLDLTGELYIGGVPASVRSRLPSNVLSRSKGFSGCMASTVINGRLFDLMNEAQYVSSSITPGCTNTTQFCSPGVCQHFGVCYEGINTFRCDCNMTSFVGSTCESEAEGYLFARERGGRDIVVLYKRPPADTSVDNIAFGFMTWSKDGTLLRAEGAAGTGHFIEASLVGGHVVYTYNVGNGVQKVVENSRMFNDGRYHYVRFTRTGDSVVLSVDDDLQMSNAATVGGSASTLFRQMWVAKVGGDLDINNNIINYFNGIIAGVYINGYRMLDMSIDGHRSASCRGDCKIAPHRFYLPPPTIDPDEPSTGEENGAGGISVGEGGAGDKDLPASAAVVGSSVAGGDVGTRAAAVTGTMLGLLAAASSLVWALYKFKPGLIGGAAKGAAGTAGASANAGVFEMALSASNSNGVESAATATTPLLGANASGAKNAGNGHGPPTEIDEAPMTRSVNLADHFSPMWSAPTASAPPPSATGTMTRGIQTDVIDDDVDLGFFGVSDSASTAVSRSYNHLANDAAAFSGGGMFDSSWANAGTQTGPPPGYNSSGIVGNSLAYVHESRQMSNTAASSTLQGSYSVADSAYIQQQKQYQLQLQQQQQQQLLLQQQLQQQQQQQQLLLLQEQQRLQLQQQQQQLLLNARSMARSPTPVDIFAAGVSSSGGYQMRNILLSQQQQQFSSSHQGLLTTNGSAGVSVPNLMAAEEIRVDCIQLTTNGRYVVTGSIYGPPQVWDLKTGNLVKVMAGDDFSSTDLHLANGDTLLVGQVAELKQVDAADLNASTRLHHRKLQIWDFDTGRPLEMRKNEVCTASCMMNNGEHIVLGRTDRFGGSTSVVVWDVLGNEPIRQLNYDACLGLADHISYLKVSPDDHYVIAGVQNSLDGNANFVIFDLKQQQPPRAIALNARAEVTVVLDNEEAVTGTQTGDMNIWSLRTGKVVRRFGGDGHLAEINDLALSKDRATLVSASSDKTLKIWNVEAERPVHTLRGHTDEVWCCTISNDNELVASGSRDLTIRLWRTSDGSQVAAINAGVDVFRVLLSNNKQTIVALADKIGARKLIMLQIVRSKTKTVSDASSRVTSPTASTPLTPNFHRQF